MKKVFLIVPLFVATVLNGQIETPEFNSKEFLQYKISYGLLNAGFATMEINDTLIANEEIFHVIGKGWTTGMTHLFFPVNDNYQTYFTKNTIKPLHFIRKVREGGYTMDREINFDYENYLAEEIDHKKGTQQKFEIHDEIQDMLSALYYIRTLDLSNLKEGESISIDVFFDKEINNFKLKLIGREILTTKFGKTKTLIFTPIVQVGRIFKEKESVTMWVTDDKNKLPIKIKASILIGSIKAELYQYKGLANPFPIIFN